MKKKTEFEGHVDATVRNSTPLLFDITVLHGMESVFVNVCADHGSNESIVSDCIAEKVVLNRVDKISKINSVKLVEDF